MRNVGLMDEKIIIQARTSTAGQSSNTITTTLGEFGEPLIEYGDNLDSASEGVLWDEVYAQVIEKEGTEIVVEGREVNKIPVEFRIRYYSKATTRHQVKWGTRVFDIQAIINKRRYGQTILHTEEIV